MLKRQTHWLACVIAAAALCHFAPGGAAAAVDVSVAANGEVHILQNGQPLDTRPARILVQEWTAGEVAQKTKSASQQSQPQVGSIVAVEQLESRLSPVGDAWNATPQVITAQQGADVEQRWQFPHDIEVLAHWSKTGDGLRVRGEVVNRAPADTRDNIPLTISLAIPLSDDQLRWLASIRRSEPIRGEEEYIVSVPTTAGARAAMSLYPFGAVSGQSKALALGFPLDQPRIHRIRWDGKHRCLVAELDASLSSLPQKLANRVPFEFLVFDFDKEFGFRAAAQNYYALNPDSYNLRLKEQGQWMPFTQLDKVNRAQDFAFKFHEYHPDVSVAWDWQHGVWPLVYCEPPVEYVVLDDTFPKQVTALESYLKDLPTAQASQIRNSGTFTADGHLLVNWVNTPWAKGARVPTNCDPDIPRSEANPVNAFDEKWRPYAELYRARAEDSPSDWTGDGRIVDGVVGANGRALHLTESQSAAQQVAASGPIPTSLRLAFKAKARNQATLRVQLNGSTQEVSLSPHWRDYHVEFPSTDAQSPQSGTSPRLNLTLTAVKGEIWIDDLQADALNIRNADFEKGEHDAEAVAGLYMDSFEGWDSYELNFREDHLKLVDYPLTFDTRTGRTAQVIMFHNYEFAAEVRQRLHARQHLLMANTVLYQWPWSAHFVDVLGIEMPWGNWATADRLDYIRTLSYHKPYCLLLNVRFETFRANKVAEYFAKCFVYGLWPGFFSHDAATNPYWEGNFYEEDRPYFLRFMRPQQRMTAAGWEPITLAHANDPAILVERWGGGAYSGKELAPPQFFLAIHNASDTTRTVQLTIDPRLTGGHDYLGFDLLRGRVVANTLASTPTLTLAPHDSSGISLLRRDATSLESGRGTAFAEIVKLFEKYASYGFVEPAILAKAQALRPNDAAEIHALVRGALQKLEPLYASELRRVYSEWQVLSSAHEETRTGAVFAPTLPPAIVPGRSFTVTVNEPYSNRSLVLTYEIGNQSGTVDFSHGQASFSVPTEAPLGTEARLLIQAKDAKEIAPYYETSLPVLPPITLSGPPKRLCLLKETQLTIQLINNLSEPIEGTLSVQAPAELKPISARKLTLVPGKTVEFTIPLQVQTSPAADKASSLEVTFQSDNATARAQLPMTILPQGASVLRASDVTVSVDSTYLGYGTAPLNDGVTDTRGVEWQDAAWASDEGEVPHWVEFTLPHPTTIRQVVLYWALDDGKYWTSRRVKIQVEDPANGEWKTVATHEGTQPTPRSQLDFAPVQTTRLRVYQESGDGPPARRGILWLAEVEAR